MPSYNPNYNSTNSNSVRTVNAYPIEVKAAPVVVPVPVSSPPSSSPSSLPDVLPQSNKNVSSTAKSELSSQGYTNGLIQSIADNKSKFPIRIWVVDNSGSMTTPDGHRLHLMPNNTVKHLDCTRWAEIQDTISYHARVAAMLEAPTHFKLLNPTCGMQQFGIADKGTASIQEDLRNAMDTIRTVQPIGVTPLADRVREITSYIKSVRNQLDAKGQKAVVILATDGLPSDQYGSSSSYTMNEFKNALRSMEGLPVWLVIRLCTDDEEVVDFYNNIDSQLEMSCDVLDDFSAEALEVYEHNKWLNYALPFHRMREMGFYHKLFDLIDERPLTKDELKEFFLLIFGADSMDGLPDPQLDWQGFRDRIAAVNSRERLQWNPIKKKMTPWVDIRKLDRKYGDSPTCFSFF